MGILPLKKRVNRDKCSFTIKQRMFGWNITPEKARKSRLMQFREKTAYVWVFAIDEILRYRGTRFPGSRTLCHPALHLIKRLPHHAAYPTWLKKSPKKDVDIWTKLLQENSHYKRGEKK